MNSILFSHAVLNTVASAALKAVPTYWTSVSMALENQPNVASKNDLEG